jgi:hypothetical protein
LQLELLPVLIQVSVLQISFPIHQSLSNITFYSFHISDRNFFVRDYRKT